MSDTVLVSCPQCQTQNRIPVEKIGQQAKCGKCGAAFPANVSASPVHVTDQTFQQEILNAALPVVLDFWAPWCGPCRMIAPVLEELAKEYAGKVKIAKINTDENQQTAAKYQIQGIPTLLFIKNGQIVDQIVGAAPKPMLKTKIQALL